ncbi:MAG: hypothetical protein DCC88_02490 [Spirobacillus cienkowskii]|uniref:Uncharacterized protein n=1 Tax=Spirobacillus cienkowskii TaxID=495820 RepID=A0A369KQQ5_9BACT|nr:MAG: hypothetical protein DCC88_02490 [Spirobacillus cienkowskii]
MYKSIFKIALTSLSICGFYFGNASANNNSQNFCQVLGQKLNNKYSNGSISTLTYFNYSLLGGTDYYQRTEYKFDYSDYSNSLEDCSYTNYGNGDERVKLRLTRVTPITIDQYNNPVHNLTFEIDMRSKKLVYYSGSSNYVNSWHVNSVSSQNCEEIITTSLITKYKNDFERENRVISSNFNNLIRHMVYTHVCNAHYFSLKNIFNDVIKG